MQLKVGTVVDHIKNQIGLVEEEPLNAQRTDQAIMNVKKSVFDVAGSIEKIKVDTQKQKQTISGIMENSQTVAAVAQETSAGSEEVAASALEQSVIMEERASYIQGLASETLNLVEQVKTLKVN